MASQSWFTKILIDTGNRIGKDYQLRREFSELVGVLDSTVRLWFKGHNEPVGLPKLKAYVLLEHLGYKILDYTDLNPEIHIFGKHIGFGLYDFKEASKFLDLSDAHLFNILFNKAGSSNEIIELMKLYNEDNSSKLESHILKLSLFATKLNASKPEPPPEPKPEPKLTTPVSFDKLEIIELFVSLAHAIRPLAAKLASDAYTAEEREQLRDKMGSFGIFNLKNDLIKLCGERARQTM